VQFSGLELGISNESLAIEEHFIELSYIHHYTMNLEVSCIKVRFEEEDFVGSLSSRRFVEDFKISL
jgi:hypothetical protein